MPEEKPEVFLYSYKDVVTALVRDRNIHEGLWLIRMEFKILAINAGPGPEEVYPTAVVPVTGIGIQRTKEPHLLAVDAAKVNPRRKTKPLRKKPARK